MSTDVSKAALVESKPESATQSFEVTKSSTILFTTIPVIFFKLPGGALISGLFYLLVAFAALSSTISLLALGLVIAALLVPRLPETRGIDLVRSRPPQSSRAAACSSVMTSSRKAAASTPSGSGKR